MEKDNSSSGRISIFDDCFHADLKWKLKMSKFCLARLQAQFKMLGRCKLFLKHQKILKYKPCWLINLSCERFSHQEGKDFWGQALWSPPRAGSLVHTAGGQRWRLYSHNSFSQWTPSLLKLAWEWSCLWWKKPLWAITVQKELSRKCVPFHLESKKGTESAMFHQHK